MYPMVLMCLGPLSAPNRASMPHVLVSSGYPPVPNPILESQLMQSSSLLPRIPILALACPCLGMSLTALNPSLLQLRCNEPWEPSNVFHLLRPSDMARNCPSAINECSESAVLFIRIKYVASSPWILIPKQILENGVVQ